MPSQQKQKTGVLLTLFLQTVALVYFFATTKATIESDVNTLKYNVSRLVTKQEQVIESLREMEVLVYKVDDILRRLNMPGGYPRRDP